MPAFAFAIRRLAAATSALHFPLARSVVQPASRRATAFSLLHSSPSPLRAQAAPPPNSSSQQPHQHQQQHDEMRKVLNELAKNPKAYHIFQTIKRDPKLLNEIEALGKVLLAKGYISANDGAVSQPGPFIMMKMFADTNIRARMLKVAAMLEEAGALDADGKDVDPSNMMDLLLGASQAKASSPSANPSPKSPSDPEPKDQVQGGGVVSAVKGLFGKKANAASAVRQLRFRICSSQTIHTAPPSASPSPSLAAAAPPSRRSKKSSTSASSSSPSATSAASLAKAALLVSSPHPTSHIRLLRFQEPPEGGLTPVEREWRAHREAVQRWHHDFWTENNTHFQREKAEFEANVQSLESRPATPHELSVFYKQYLDSSFERHARYNRALWQSNARMLVLAARAELCALKRVAGNTVAGLDLWWARVGHTIVRVGGGYRAQGITYR
ncbi:Apoptogenic protein 1, mitochondrial [Geranomyces variabilis]|nr:Apoptogenic protein 1, mitochondrial [Geranomyces variabilis]